MFRYIGLCWDSSDHDQTASAKLLGARIASSNSDWSSVLDAPGLMVWCADARERANTFYRLDDNQGVIVGKLFPRDSIANSVSSLAISAAESRRIVETKAAHLVESYWGRYIAFWRQPNGDSFVLRDPSGTFPCFTTSFRGIHVYFSWLEDCVRLGVFNFNVNWDYVALLVAMAVVESSATGLSEVTQLYPGQRVQVNRARSGVDLAWSPGRFATSSQIEDVSEAARELRTTVMRCVRQWASCYDGIVHRMSGGIDSTIVLGCFKNWSERPRITGLVHYLPGSRTDETPFARIAAAFADCKLVECERSSQVDLEPLLRMHRLPTSYSCMPYTQNDGVERRVAADEGASAVFSGGSGDQVFYQSRVGLSVSDYLARHGIGRKLLPLALSAARLEKLSVWAILQAAMRDSRSRTVWEPVAEAGKHWPLLNADLVASVRGQTQERHPWLESARGATVGKQWHVYSLTAPPTYYDARCNPDDPEYVHPLQSQPILETSLRIPTYNLTRHGWDRWLARQAFANEMPPEIATRRSKCALDDHLERVVERNLRFIKSFLLDGLLVEKRFVDKQKLEDVLSRRFMCADSPTVEILQYVSVESWARSWTETRRAAAA